MRQGIERAQLRTVAEAIDAYLADMTERGLRQVRASKYKIECFFPLGAAELEDGSTVPGWRGRDLCSLGSLTEDMCAQLYRSVRTRFSKKGRRYTPASHRAMLSESKSMLRWCAEQKWIPASPAVNLKGQGKKNHGGLGRPKLRFDEAAIWYSRALALANAGDQGAVAALSALLMGCRASELTKRDVRDVDDGCKILVIEDAKTPTGWRNIKIPDVLRPLFVRLTEGRDRSAPLFANRFGKHHHKTWPRRQVRRICEDSKVPYETAHGMRGAFATYSHETGAPGDKISEIMGHASEGMTKASYATPEAVHSGQQQRVIDRFTGAN